MRLPFLQHSPKIAPEMVFDTSYRLTLDLQDIPLAINGEDRVLSPVSSVSLAMNTSSATPSSRHSTPNGTIRSVPAEPNHLETTDSRRGQSKTDTMPHSSLRQSVAQPTPTNPSLPPLTSRNNIVRQISSEFGGIRSYTTGSLQSTDPATSPNGGDGQWSAAVGRANLGKSGRVIEKLMGEVDSLKRQLNFEKLRADEAERAYKSAKSLHDAQSNKLATIEQQHTNLESSVRLQERVNGQLKFKIVESRSAADRAKQDAEKWAEEAQKVESEYQVLAEKMITRAELAEGRSNALESHWADQRAEQDRRHAKMRAEIEHIVALRCEDDRLIQLLKQVSEQQAKEFERVVKEKEEISAVHERYKIEQEAVLCDMKNRLIDQGDRMEEGLRESKEVLGKLNWALNVKKNVSDAQ